MYARCVLLATVAAIYANLFGYFLEWPVDKIQLTGMTIYFVAVFVLWPWVRVKE